MHCHYNRGLLFLLENTMTTSYKELLQQRAALDAQIAEARLKEFGDAVAKVRALVAEYEMDVEDVFPPAKARSSASVGQKVAPKYRNPSTGETWTGRGKAPKWIADQDRSQFLI